MRKYSSLVLAAAFALSGWLLVSRLIAQQEGGLFPDLGPVASLRGKRVFSATDPWNKDISHWPVDPASTTLVANIGADKPLHPDFGAPVDGRAIGIPYVVIDSERVPSVPVTFQYADESDRGPYPIPMDAPVEGGPQAGGDRHVLVIDRRHWKLYELFDAHLQSDGARWRAGSGAIFDLTANTVRPSGWTSADAAGLPVFPGLARYDEVHDQGVIRHALRFTCAHTRRAYIAPAGHFASASDDPALPPMGLRVRLKANFDVAPFPPAARVVLTALKTYGMILADNGSDWFVSGAPDPRWDNGELGTLKRVKGGDFEVVREE